MARKTLTERRADKLAQLDSLKQEIAKMEELAASRIGKLAVRAGLADLDLEDAELLKEFEMIVGRFRGNKEIKPRQKETANGQA